jgi:hypothetical protein
MCYTQPSIPWPLDLRNGGVALQGSNVSFRHVHSKNLAILELEEDFLALSNGVYPAGIVLETHHNANGITTGILEISLSILLGFIDGKANDIAVNVLESILGISVAEASIGQAKDSKQDGNGVKFHGRKKILWICCVNSQENVYDRCKI